MNTQNNNKLLVWIEVRDKQYNLIRKFDGKKFTELLRFEIEDGEHVDRTLIDIGKFFQVATPERIVTIEVRYFDNVSVTYPLLKSLEVNQGKLSEIKNH